MFLVNAAMEKISIGTAALIVVLGMAVVFFGLILLMYVTKIAGAIISRKNLRFSAKNHLTSQNFSGIIFKPH